MIDIAIKNVATRSQLTQGMSHGSIPKASYGCRYCGVAGVENLSCVNASSHLIASSNRKRRYSTDEPVTVSTQPSKWPGNHLLITIQNSFYSVNFPFSLRVKVRVMNAIQYLL